MKWEKSDTSYAQRNTYVGRDYSITGNNISQIIVKSFTSAYWFFISDVDGDNCPFDPSCSRFLIEAVKETNLPQGVLMFFDRFTRDLNVFGRLNKYPRFGATSYYDPVTLYTLDENEIKYLPPNTFIKNE
jgi:putative component of membrane protein insertase Oxa1/YidC/SpoIIIJ protein YidD